MKTTILLIVLGIITLATFGITDIIAQPDDPRIEPYATTAAQQKCYYIIDPKEDITAYELAVLLCAILYPQIYTSDFIITNERFGRHVKRKCDNGGF